MKTYSKTLYFYYSTLPLNSPHSNFILYRISSMSTLYWLRNIQCYLRKTAFSDIFTVIGIKHIRLYDENKFMKLFINQFDNSLFLLWSDRFDFLFQWFDLHQKHGLNRRIFSSHLSQKSEHWTFRVRNQLKPIKRCNQALPLTYSWFLLILCVLAEVPIVFWWKKKKYCKLWYHRLALLEDTFQLNFLYIVFLDEKENLQRNIQAYLHLHIKVDVSSVHCSFSTIFSSFLHSWRWWMIQNRFPDPFSAIKPWKRPILPELKHEHVSHGYPCRW